MAGKKQKALRKKIDINKKGVLKQVRKRRQNIKNQLDQLGWGTK